MSGKFRITNFFTFKDRFPSFLHSGVVYKFQCGGYIATCYGKTKRHPGILALTEKRIKGDDDSAIKKHLWFCNHAHGFEDFSILTRKNGDFKVTLMENRDQTPLNRQYLDEYFWIQMTLPT